MRIIQEHAEQAFLDVITGSQTQNILRCAFSTLAFHATPDEISDIAIGTLNDASDATVYACHDGDIFVTWSGGSVYTADTLLDLLKERYKLQLAKIPADEVFRSYNIKVHADDLAKLMRDKLGQPASQPKLTVAASRPKPSFNEDQMIELAKMLRHRKRRAGIEILIVEDEEFSRKMLLGLLEKDWICHSAKDGAEAIQMYAQHAPNICFLDVELPDANGHDLAELFRANDPEKFIVMVTASHYVHDVITAKQNKVDGFIVKPYNKQKILHAVELHMIKNAM